MAGGMTTANLDDTFVAALFRAKLLPELRPALTTRRIVDWGPTGNSTAFSILLEAGDRMGFRVTWIQYGAPLASVIVDSINGTKSGDGGRWWQYWVDGAYGDVGADHKPLADGSEVLWAFREYPPREA